MISKEQIELAKQYALESGYSYSSKEVVGMEAKNIYRAVLYGVRIALENPNNNLLIDFVHYCRLQEEKRGKKGGAEKFISEFLKYKSKWEGK